MSYDPYSETTGYKNRSRNMKPCNCIGPQNGEPLCPCLMKDVIQRNGRWIQPEQDLGPTKKAGDRLHRCNKDKRIEELEAELAQERKDFRTAYNLYREAKDKLDAVRKKAVFSW